MKYKKMRQRFKPGYEDPEIKIQLQRILKTKADLYNKKDLIPSPG